MAKMKGLGRGLDALLGSDADTNPGDALRTLNIDLLRPGIYQPRTRMDQDSLAQLADSIRAQGIMQPILARRQGEGGYEIIAGERRWRAAKQAGLQEVPVLVRDVADEAALAMSLIENIQRENLNPLEEAAGIRRLVEEFRMTHQQASEAVGRSRSAVTNLLRLLNLAPAVQDLVMDNRLDMGHARALLALAGPMQTDVAQQVAQRQLSVRETERLVQRAQQQPLPPPPSPDRDVQRLEEGLSDKLGARVTLKVGKGGKGKIVIEYANLMQLESLIDKL